MATSETAYNSALSTIISRESNMQCDPEHSKKSTKGQRPDLTVYRKGSTSSILIEAKIGTAKDRKKMVIDDARVKLRLRNVYGALALCYPDEIKNHKDASDIESFLMKCDNLEWAEVNERNLEGIENWQTGNWKDLCSALEYVGTSDVEQIAKDLGGAISSVVDYLTDSDKEKIADILDLPKDPKKKTYDNAAKIGSLLLANGMMFHERLAESSSLKNNGVYIKNLQWCLGEEPSAKINLEKAWKQIQEIDYYPIFAPARSVLGVLPDHPRSETALDELGKCVRVIFLKVQGLQADFMGKLYHRLLDTARYDGSFYTSTPAAFLLARLGLPDNFVDWSDGEAISQLKICDPSCGTGTLLLASGHTCMEKYRLSKTQPDADDLDLLHLALAEDVLNGLDINLHAVQLAASMIAMSNPKVDFNRMGIWRVQFGVKKATKGITTNTPSLGSLGLLQGDTPQLPFPDQSKMGGEEEKEDYPDLTGKCDLVIMNPPFTRDSLRYDQLSKSDEKAMKDEEVNLLKNHPHGESAHRSSIEMLFNLLAYELNSNRGRIAIIKPFAAFSNSASKGIREFLFKKYHIELIITSHDPNRIYFSENTSITEGLVIGRRKQENDQIESTNFLNLYKNPSNVFDALALANDIAKGNISKWGTMQKWPAEKMKEGNWLPCFFYSKELTDAVQILRSSKKLATLGDLAYVGPDGRGIRDKFSLSPTAPQAPDYFKALWHHKTDLRETMLISAKSDCQDIAVKNKKSKTIELAKKYWSQKSQLLIANRLRLNLVKTPSCFVDGPVVGSAWVPITPNEIAKDMDLKSIMKAWCVWLNSTPSIVMFLSMRSKDLTYSQFSLDHLRSFPVPDPTAIGKKGINILNQAFEDNKKKKILSLPEINNCGVRHALDKAVCRATGLNDTEISKWREAITKEPTVNFVR